jgi:hypothetical protein
MQLSSRFPRSVDVVVHPLALQAGGPALTISGLIRRNAEGLVSTTNPETHNATHP